jgi:hypothetical protein
MKGGSLVKSCKLNHALDSNKTDQECKVCTIVRKDSEGATSYVHIKAKILLLLSLAPQLSLGLGLLHTIQLNFLEASQQFSFFTG